MQWSLTFDGSHDGDIVRHDDAERVTRPSRQFDVGRVADDLRQDDQAAVRAQHVHVVAVHVADFRERHQGLDLQAG